MSRETPRPQEYRLIVIELDDVVPRRDPMKPNLYVAKTVIAPDERLATIQRSKKSHWYTGHIVRLRSDLVNSRAYKSSEDAQQAYTRLIKNLTSEGFTVNQNTQVWNVYVIELDGSAVANPGKGYVYVGETSCTPEERFKQHREGARNKHGRLYAAVVKQHGVKLRPDLAPGHKYFDQASAKRGEKEHYEKLKARGFNVKGGH